jgi:hypothetical protein
LGGKEHTGFWWGNRREGDHLKDLGVDGRIILKWMLKEYHGGDVDWSDLARDRNIVGVC